jgi:hypothetical protein
MDRMGPHTSDFSSVGHTNNSWQQVFESLLLTSPEQVIFISFVRELPKASAGH